MTKQEFTHEIEHIKENAINELEEEKRKEANERINACALAILPSIIQSQAESYVPADNIVRQAFMVAEEMEKQRRV